MTFITSVLALLVTFGWLTQADAQTLEQVLAATLVAIVAVVTNGAVVWHYINSRTDVKLADAMDGQFINPADVALEVVTDERNTAS